MFWLLHYLAQPIKVMTCGLFKFKNEIATHYVGKSGNEYPINEYANLGSGKTEKGIKDLPLDEYPYTIKYETELKYKCCQLCSCEGKENI
jgi:hypothetical protein